MKPRYTHFVFALTALVALAGGVAAILYLPGADGAARKRATLQERVAILLPALRSTTPAGAPASPAPAGPVHVQASAPVHVQATPPDKPAPPEPPPSTISALEALPPLSALPADDAPPEDPNGPGWLQGEVSLPTPVPPARPADLAKLAQATPQPPRRPADLASLAAPTPQDAVQPATPQDGKPQDGKPQPIDGAETAPQPVAPQAQQAAPEAPPPIVVNAPLPPARPADLASLVPARSAGPDAALQQLARLPDGALQPAPDDAFQQAPIRFGMGSPVFIRIFKQEGQLELHLRKSSGRYALYKTYPICKWSGRLGPKLREADYQSPEGFYSVSVRQLHPNSNYHRAFNVGYPNAFDRQNGRTGGLVMVHGACKSVGCFAMTDAGIEEIYGFVDAALRAGQKEIPVHIFPFHMTDHAIAHETGGNWLSFASGSNNAQWGAFWKNLKEGYDLFEQTGEPPIAYACGDHYAFGGADASCRRVAGW